ncbi:hypothetical protein DACRYDRAFT_63411 [Dacryopinax primogenitus]|uniref:Rrn9 domain-containing protein n=1 Tax=Dacryopinax primogenitus (strain DJM 731) TaxID=1858805 RepID=M5GE39_DACPD|nr:uncharacterized protein DACRYDRAFT_63411 [Dacryopinax primogenitus]EJU05057.1 hypothetical protein DACRYDRAFT_63411 [Dacryopinax primogenitus]
MSIISVPSSAPSAPPTPSPSRHPSEPEGGHAAISHPHGSRLVGVTGTGTSTGQPQGTLQRRRHLAVPHLTLDNTQRRSTSRTTATGYTRHLTSTNEDKDKGNKDLSDTDANQGSQDIEIEDADNAGDTKDPQETQPRVIARLPHALPTVHVHHPSQSPPRISFTHQAYNFPFAFLMSAPATPIAIRPGQAQYNAAQLAHKSAHYLHSIPPREKTTRTLILDHVLWKHGKARFAQARAELGLRILKEDEDEDLEDTTDEVDEVDALGYRPSGRPAPTAFGPGDPSKAKVFKTHAEGHENVLSAMLEQPPELPYHQWDEDSSASSTVKAPPLPNGVRLRLTLTSLVNDFFARDEDPVIVSRGAYPPSISQLQMISNPCAPASSLPTLPSLADLFNPSSTGPAATPPSAPSSTSGPSQGGAKPTSIWAIVPRGLGPEAPWTFAGTLQAPQPPSSGTGSTSLPPQPGPSEWPKLNAPTPATPAARAIALYNAGAQAPLNPIQCARHLTPCNCSTGPATNTHASRHIGAGLRRPSLRLLRRRSNFLSTLGGERALPTSRLTDLLPRFIRLSALVAIELGREAAGEESTRPSATTSNAGDTTDSSAASPYTSDAEGDGDRPPVPARPSRAWYALLCTLCTRACLEGYLARGWRGTEGVETLFGLGVDLGMSLDGLLDDDAATAAAAGSDESMTDTEDGQELEPDGWPTMEEAARVLFPGSGSAEDGYPAAVGSAQAEYEQEMRARRDMFLDFPPNTNDLRSHLMDLAGRFPPEPMERSALRFCEAVSRWRGRPELQANPHKSRLRSMSIVSQTSQSALSIASVIHPSPSSRPAIDRWFVVPSRSERRRSLAVRAALGTGKRKRTEGSGEAGASSRKGKKVDRTDSKGYVEEDDWVDPYGIPG